MSSRIQYKRQVSDAPMVIGSVDPEVAAYVAGLDALTLYSTTSGQLWGFTVGGDAAVEGGTAYLVSAAAFKRIEAGRFS
jgi:hypothetical protein